jgi:hypothetical protein
MLKDGVKSFMNLLSSHSKLISFISTGGIKDLPPDHQPSLLVLHFFEMLHFFSAERVLLYKSEMKSTSFPKPFENSLFFDDSQECLDDIRNSILGVSVIDSKSIQDYHPQVLLGRLNELIALQKTKD